MESILSKMFKFVISTSRKYNIDESHGLSHSMNVLQYAHNIYASELITDPSLESQQKVIYCAAVLHDMCDKKYIDEDLGIKEINAFLVDNGLTEDEITLTLSIINTMSYSTVKKNGFPDLGENMKPYHIVREADLLTAYDFDRCMIYNLYNKDGNLTFAFDDASTLFKNRVFKHLDDNLLTTKYSQREHVKMTEIANHRISVWMEILQSDL